MRMFSSMLFLLCFYVQIPKFCISCHFCCCHQRQPSSTHIRCLFNICQQNHNIDLCLIWSSSAPTPTLMPLDCALSLPLLRAYHSTHLKHKCFRPSFMNLYNGQFDNSAHRGFRDKRCQLLMHSMNMPPSVGFFLSAILQCLEEQFGYGMSSTFNYTR
jgi:hypothetical protein